MSILLKNLFLSLAACLVLTGSIRAQYWMQKGGGVTVDEAYDIALDSSGNTYSTGYFTGSASFGSSTLNASGGTDIFVAKTDDQGDFQWAVKAGGSGADRGLSIHADDAGNCYVTGYFNGSATFDTVTLVSDGLQDIFIAMYNTNGVLQWARRAGGALADQGSGISLDNSGNIIVTGEFRDSASFGATTLVSGGNTDAFISKLTASGTFTWTEHGTGTGAIRGTDVSCDNSGNLYAIGQFSGIITFDATHPNTMFNVIYLVKFNSSGQEQWFRIIGAASSNIAHSIVSDANGNAHLTGDFTGTLTFFGTTNTTLGGTYSERVFVAKYNNSGTLQWASSSSSDSEVSSQTIALDDSGNVYLAGHFECRMDEYSDDFGEAIFNSVGYNDIFVSKFNSSGTRQYSRHIGGPDEDYGYGVAANDNGNIHIAGSFETQLNFPTTGNFLSGNLNNWTQNNCTNNANYCSDANYANFYSFSASGNQDAVIANCFDPTREPYDYYLRSGSSCDRSMGSVCIASNNNCVDTISGCSPVSADAITGICPSIGPNLTWQWSTGWIQQTGAQNYFAGTWSVTQNTADGCFSSVDSVYADVYPNPPKPTITDDVVVNDSAIVAQEIEICGPDSVILTGGNIASGTSVLWMGPGLGSGVADDSCTASQSGVFNFTVSDSNGCETSHSVLVEIFEPLPAFVLKLNIDDSITVCEGQDYSTWGYDSVANSAGNMVCFSNLPYNVSTMWTLDPDTIAQSQVCGTQLNFLAQDTGYHVVSLTVVRFTPCDTDTHYVIDSVYITVLPSPEVPPFNVSITGSHYYCPADTTLLVASGGPNYSWTNGSTNDSVYAHAGFDGDIQVTSTVSDTNQYGCITTFTAYATHCIDEKPQPTVTPNTTLICPGDSVQLSCSHQSTGPPCWLFPFGGDFHWEGPSGPIDTNTSIIFVTEPGAYYCVYNDADSCNLVSNTVMLQQYTTPQLLPIGDPVLCEGDSVTIAVISNEGSLIEWQPPLSGNGTQQTVYEAGVYTCNITSCGITTSASVEVFASYVEAEITTPRELCLDDTIVLYASPGMATYQWFPDGQTSDTILVSDPGSFQVITTDTNGCTALSDSFHVLMEQVPTVVSIDTIPTFCQGDTMLLFSNADMTSYTWSPTGDTVQNIAVTNAGIYSLTTTDTNGCVGSDTIELFMPDPNTLITAAGDTAFCEGDHVLLNAMNNNYATYTWSPGGESGKQLIVTESGTYTLNAIDTFGCLATSQSISVKVESKLSVTPKVSDTVTCRGIAVTLHATSDIGEIQWYDETSQTWLESGDEFTTPVLEDNALYYVWTTSSLCESEGIPVLVEVINCDNIDVPNVLTPNGDGLNDVWRIELEEATCFECQVYNRWGQLIYRTNYMGFAWDGTVTNTGEIAPEGSYYYLIEYCRFDGSEAQQRGIINLFRGSNR